jgi:beta-glucosidase
MRYCTRPSAYPAGTAANGAPDFVGVNYYFRRIVRAADNFLGAEQIDVTGVPTTDMGWEIHPDGLLEILARVRDEYGPPSIAVTENGIALEGVDDPGRVEYLRDHVDRAGKIADAYFVWSLLDNFEWAWGYRMRFGIVHVDYETQLRTVKTSGRWYADRIRAR